MLTSEHRYFHKRLLEYTPSELEQRGTRSLCAYERWALDAPLAFSPRLFSYSGGLYLAQMIPRGRRLIANNVSGVFLYDLHSPCPQPHELFDPGGNDEKDNTMDRLRNFNLWIDPTVICSASDTLRFRVVLWRQTGPQEGRTPAIVFSAY